MPLGGLLLAYGCSPLSLHVHVLVLWPTLRYTKYMHVCLQARLQPHSWRDWTTSNATNTGWRDFHHCLVELYVHVHVHTPISTCTCTCIIILSCTCMCVCVMTLIYVHSTKGVGWVDESQIARQSCYIVHVVSCTLCLLTAVIGYWTEGDQAKAVHTCTCTCTCSTKT